MAFSRLALAFVLLGVVAGGATAALVKWRASEEGASGAFSVEVAGPEGALFSGTVRVEDATALSVLLATGLSVETTDYPGMGTYVDAIEGHRASGASGWVFEVLREGAWRSGDRSAARYALEPGDAVRWSWTGG